MKVYLITNKINKKKYVGQTIKPINVRWYQHGLETSQVSCLRNAVNKYGKEKFSIDECNTKEEMDFVEIFYISLLNTKAPEGYNLTDGGEGSIGLITTEATKKKQSAAKLGKHLSPKTEIKIGQRKSPDTEVKQGQRLSPRTEFKKGHTTWNKGKFGLTTKQLSELRKEENSCKVNTQP